MKNNICKVSLIHTKADQNHITKWERLNRRCHRCPLWTWSRMWWCVTLSSWHEMRVITSLLVIQEKPKQH